MEPRPARPATRDRFRTGAPPTAPCALPEQRPLVASHPAPSVEAERFPATQVQVTAKNVLPGRPWLLMEQQRVTSAPQAEPKVILGVKSATSVPEEGTPAMLEPAAARVAPLGSLELIQALRNVQIVLRAEPKVGPGKTNASTALLARSRSSLAASGARIARETFTPSRLLLDATDAKRAFFTAL